MSKPRESLPPDVRAKLLDPKDRKLVQKIIAEAHAVGPNDGVINEAFAKAYGTVCALYRLVDELRTKLADLTAHDEQIAVENERLWEGIANLYDHLNPDQITAELRRRGIEIAELPAVITEAMAKRQEQTGRGCR